MDFDIQYLASNLRKQADDSPLRTETCRNIRCEFTLWISEEQILYCVSL